MSQHHSMTRKRVLGIAAVLVISVPVVAALQKAPPTLSSDFGQVKDARQAYALVVELAQDAVSTDPNLGRNRVSVSDGVLVYDFQPAPETSLTSRPSRLTTPLELLIRIDALSRDFHSAIPTQEFWGPPLERLRGLASHMVDAAFHSPSEDQWRLRKQKYEDQVGQEFAALAKEVRAFASKTKLDVKTARGSSNGYKVEIRIEPPKAHVKFMTYLDYRKCKAFKLNLEDYWVDLDPGIHALIGKYHYLAEWPASLNGPEEANFEVTDDMPRTFVPKGK